MALQEFSSSLTRGGNVFTPQTIIITDYDVTLKQRNKWLIGVDTITIPRNKIASIEIDDKVWGADIYIYSVGGAKIEGKNFTGSDAKRIKQILEDRL